VSGITEATWVTAGWFDTCAVVSNSHVECWGINGEGELGNGKTGNPSDTPVKVSGISEASQVTAGRDHACARLSTGHIECWGNNQYGQLGDGEAGNESDTPKKVKGI
jgi:alpha-tubulin suppressor-like RCC1 family protein